MTTSESANIETLLLIDDAMELKERIKRIAARLVPPPETERFPNGFFRKENTFEKADNRTGKRITSIQYELHWSPAHISLKADNVSIPWLLIALREGVIGWEAETTRRYVEAETATEGRIWHRESYEKALYELGRWNVLLEALIIASQINEVQKDSRK
jgi:hypothetical protein